jgi:hypothetical protein
MTDERLEDARFRLGSDIEELLEALRLISSEIDAAAPSGYVHAEVRAARYRNTLDRIEAIASRALAAGTAKTALAKARGQA